MPPIFKMHGGFLQRGDDVHVGEAMTLTEAKTKCSEITGCSGFTVKVGAADDKTGRHKVWFKSVWKLNSEDDSSVRWTSWCVAPPLTTARRIGGRRHPVRRTTAPTFPLSAPMAEGAAPTAPIGPAAPWAGGTAPGAPILPATGRDPIAQVAAAALAGAPAAAVAGVTTCLRPLCRFGVECKRKNPKHCEEFAHPLDDDYLGCCRAARALPTFTSIQKLFVWANPSGSGKICKGQMEEVWPLIQKFGSGVGDWDASVWGQLDDGKGHLNLMDFVERVVLRYRVDLKLSVEEVFGARGPSDTSKLCCGVVGCSCVEFTPQRRRCKYGETCYQTNPVHLQHFCHPYDEDWGGSKECSDMQMCQCRHKMQLHHSVLTGAPHPPSYWESKPESDGEFQRFFPVEDISPFQDLFAYIYSDVTTRDRWKHSGKDWRVPEEFTVLSVKRNENSKLWRQYWVRKVSQQRERKKADELGSGATGTPPFKEHTDLLTACYGEGMGSSDKLDARVNEWYLLHGTSSGAAEHICKNDFKFALAGSASGTLYGHGIYFAESITKADEYSRVEGNINTVLLCRVLGGRVRYCDEKVPNTKQLTSDCVEGPYDTILGDRVKARNTYREFVAYDSEDVYPEYIVTYKRGRLVKSPSHP
jgi:hypothetical protein